uniref:Alpha/beta hydrolase fold-3 domain-containing protein n=1 Tax=Moniliophthora roreri TaxID=221103 RepID=A0A0W0FTG0_MONRR
MPLNAECGIAPASVDKTKGPATGTLKETSFIWMEPARDALVKGMAKDIKVKGVRVPGYVWPKGEKLEEGDGVVGLFIHGGGYMMGNGTEKFGELNIARLLNKRSKMKRILSVEYRLCGESCHPAQLLDGLAAYAHLVETLKIDSSRIVILGACAGGNLVMMLSRYLYEEKVLPLPGRLMLFSPVIDMAIDFEITQGMTKPRPNTEIDWLATSHLANVRFIGHHPPELAFSPYLSSNRAPPGSYTGYPPTFVSIGDAESLQQEVEQLVGLMKNDGVEITLDVQKDATHDFLAMDIVPSDSAREQAIQSACEWVDKIAVPST